MNRFFTVRLFLSLVVLLSCFVCKAQDNSALYDSLHKKGLLGSYITDQEKLLDNPAIKKLYDDILQFAINTNDEDLAIGTEIRSFHAPDENGNYRTDEKINALKELLNSERLKNRHKDRIVILHLLGSFFYNHHKYFETFKYFIEAYNLIITFPSSELRAKKHMLVSIGNAYNKLGDYDNALKAYFAADTISLIPNKRLWYLKYSNTNNIGLVYRARKDYDSAIYYFKKTASIAAVDSIDVWQGIAAGNIGICYYEQGLYQQAIEPLKKDIESCLKFEIPAYNNAINSLLILTDCHLKMDSLTMAQKDFKVFDQYVDSVKNKVQCFGKYYSVLSDYYYKTGDYKNAIIYKDSAIIYKDSLAARDNILKLEKVKYNYEKEQYNSEIEKLAAKKKITELERNGLIGGMALLLGITFLVYNRQKLKTTIKQNQLDSYTKRLQEKNALIEQSAVKIESLQQTLSDVKAEEVNNEALEQLYASTILTDEEWDEFRRFFEQVHKGFLNRLKSKMPDLSPAETRFIVLSKLKLSNKEMAGILGIQADTVRVHKHRLIKKFNLPEDVSITDYINKV